jgi:hypothetical protein
MLFNVGRSSDLASRAAICAVERGQYNTAVEFLDASRSVFWSQALHLRTALDDLARIRPDLSLKLTEIARQPEQASFRDAYRNLRSDAPDKIISIEAEGRRCRELNANWDHAIESVQILPGFEEFMRPNP